MSWKGDSNEYRQYGQYGHRRMVINALVAQREYRGLGRVECGIHDSRLLAPSSRGVKTQDCKVRPSEAVSQVATANLKRHLLI